MILRGLLNLRSRNDLLLGDRGWTSSSAEVLPTGTTAGLTVDESTAIAFPAVWAAVTTIASVIASLPLHVFKRRTDGGRDRDMSHPVYELLHTRPNPLMSSMVFRETLQGHLLLWGNAFAVIDYDRNGVIQALWPITPPRVKFELLDNGEYVYTVRVPDGREVWYAPTEILHVVGFSADGLLGSSPVRVNRESLGTAMAVERFGASYFSQGATPSGVLQHPEHLDKPGHQRLKQSWKRAHSGLSNAHKIVILEEGMKWNSISIDPEKSQALESRKFSVAEVARIFNTPPHMIADLEHATFSNIEHQVLSFEKYTLRQWMVRWEQEFNYKLFKGSERRTWFVEHDIDGLLRGDVKTRWEAYFKGFQMGGYTINEVLRRENRNPIGPEGDVRFVPLNLVTISQAIAGKPEKTPARNTPKRESDDKLREQFLPLWKDTFERLFHKQDIVVGKAVLRYEEKGDPARLQKWAASFSADHADYVRRVLCPVAVATSHALVGVKWDGVNDYVNSVATELADVVTDRCKCRLDDSTFQICIPGSSDIWAESELNNLITACKKEDTDNAV